MWVAVDLDIDLKDRFQSSHQAPGLRELIGFGWTSWTSCIGTCPVGSPISSLIPLLLLLSLLLSLLCAMCGRPGSVASSRSSCSRRVAAARLAAITLGLLGGCGGVLPEQTSARCPCCTATASVAVRVARFSVPLLVEIPEAARATLEAVWLSLRRLPRRCILLRGHGCSGAVVAVKHVLCTMIVRGRVRSARSGKTGTSTYSLPPLIVVGGLSKIRRGWSSSFGTYSRHDYPQGHSAFRPEISQWIASFNLHVSNRTLSRVLTLGNDDEQGGGILRYGRNMKFEATCGEDNQINQLTPPTPNMEGLGCVRKPYHQTNSLP